MARDHARIKLSIWNPVDDFVSLRSSEQHAYFTLMSNKGLSRCGVLDDIPSRFVRLSADMTKAKWRAAINGLVAARYVLVDEHTEEMLLRSYVRHDGVMDRANMGKATGTAFEAVVSDDLRRAIGDELARLMKEAPDLKGWEGLAMTSPTAHAMACGMESRKP